VPFKKCRNEDPIIFWVPCNFIYWMQEQYGSQFFSYSLVFRLQKFKLSLRRKEAADDLRVVLMAL